jgi:hypothetical protein
MSNTNLTRTETQLLYLASTRAMSSHCVYADELQLGERTAIEMLCRRGLVGIVNKGLWTITDEGARAVNALDVQAERDSERA